MKSLRIVWIGCLGASLFALGLLRGSTELILSGALFFVSFMLLSAQLSMYGWNDLSGQKKDGNGGENDVR